MVEISTYAYCLMISQYLHLIYSYKTTALFSFFFTFWGKRTISVWHSLCCNNERIKKIRILSQGEVRQNIDISVKRLSTSTKIVFLLNVVRCQLQCEQDQIFPCENRLGLGGAPFCTASPQTTTESKRGTIKTSLICVGNDLLTSVMWATCPLPPMRPRV